MDAQPNQSTTTEEESGKPKLPSLAHLVEPSKRVLHNVGQALAPSSPEGRWPPPSSTSKTTSSNKSVSSLLLTTSRGSAHEALLEILEGAEKVLLVTPAEKLIVEPVKALEKKIESSKDVVQEEPEEEDEVLPEVPPDTTLQNMKVVLRKRLKGVTIQELYDSVWSEGVNTDKPPFYEPWLSDEGTNDVNVEDWKFAENEGELVGDWDGEVYPQKRTVDIKFRRTTRRTIGPSELDVQHVQYCRVEGEERCIVATTVSFGGLPLADCFRVEIRFVASRISAKDLLIEIGVFVNFVKSTILASQIKAAAIEDTTKGQTNLFENIVRACNAEAEEEELAEEEAAHEREQVSCFQGLSDFFARLFGHGDLLASRDDDIAIGLRAADQKLRTAADMVEKTDVDDSTQEIMDDVVAVNDALDKLLLSLK